MLPYAVCVIPSLEDEEGGDGSLAAACMASMGRKKTATCSDWAK